MSFCPQCREEYDGSVETCAECEVALVPTLDDVEAPSHGQLICRNAEVAQALLEQLLEEGIETDVLPEPVRWADGADCPVLRVPLEAAGLVVLLVERSMRFHAIPEEDPPRAGGDEPVRTLIDMFDAGGGGSIATHPWMRKKPGQVAAMGDAAVPELVSLVEDGTPEVCRWASRRLVDLGAAGAEALRGTIWRGVRAGARECVYAAIRALDDGEEHGLTVPRGIGESVAADLASADPGVRVLAALVIGRFGTPVDVTPLIPLIDDPEPLVLEEVVEAIDSLTGVDVGIDADSDEAARAAAATRIRKWIGDSV